MHTDNDPFYPITAEQLSSLDYSPYFSDRPKHYNLNPVFGISLAHAVPFVQEPKLPRALSFSEVIPPEHYSLDIQIMRVPHLDEPEPFPPASNTTHRAWAPFVLPPLKNTPSFLREFPDRQLPYFSGGCENDNELPHFQILCFYESAVKPTQLFIYLFKMLWNFGCFTDLSPTPPFTIGDYLTFYTVVLFKAYTRVPCLVRAVLPWTCKPLSTLQKDALVRYHSQYVTSGNLPFLSPIPLAIDHYFSLLFYAKPTELLHFCTTSFKDWFVKS